MKHLRKLLDLDKHGCRWPVTTDHTGQHLFCNAQQRDKSPYCPEHHGKAYTAPPSRKANGRSSHVVR